MRRIHRASAGLLACAFFLWAAPAVAKCLLSYPEIVATAEFRNLGDQVGPRSNAQNSDVVLGYFLGHQTRYLGKNANRRAMFDCLLENAESHFFYLDVLTIEESRTLSVERFRSAVLGLTSDEDLRTAGITPDTVVRSIFANTRTVKGRFDAAAICRGNGLPAHCALPDNEMWLSIQPDGGRALMGSATVTVKRPGSKGCRDWVTRSQIQFGGARISPGNRVVEGAVHLVSHVEGFAGKTCKPFVRDVRIEGRWSANIGDDRVTGEIVTAGAKGKSKVPFSLTWIAD